MPLSVKSASEAISSFSGCGGWRFGPRHAGRFLSAAMTAMLMRGRRPAAKAVGQQVEIERAAKVADATMRGRRVKLALGVHPCHAQI